MARLVKGDRKKVRGSRFAATILLSANCQLFDRAQSKPSTANRLQPGVVAAQNGVVAVQNGVVAAQYGVVGVQNGGTFEEGTSYVVFRMLGREVAGKIEEASGTGRNVKQGWTEMERLTRKTRFLILAGPRAMAKRNQMAILKIV